MMARPKSIWRRSQSGSYYTTHFGKQIRLGHSLQEAEYNFARLFLEKQKIVQANKIESILSSLAEELGGWDVLQEVVGAMALRRRVEDVKYSP